MSTIYIKEPPTSGKVRLKTTVGDIDIELWTKEAPKACRNFIHLCMTSYYNETTFHRVVPNFIVQGGDPTGTGFGGESCYGGPFKDEFHSRLRFNRRGLVAMANSGKNQNESQFFFTLADTHELEKKHTIFGTVAGETVFNMIKLGEGIVNPKTEKPEVLHRIKFTQIILNPFTDIVIEKPSSPPTTVREPVEQLKAIRNYSLLSFVDDDIEDCENPPAIFIPKPSVSNKVEVIPVTPVEEPIEQYVEKKAVTTVDVLQAEADKLRSEIMSISDKAAKRHQVNEVMRAPIPSATIADYDEEFAVYSRIKRLPDERKLRMEMVEKMLGKFKCNFRNRNIDALVEYSDDEDEAPWLHHRLCYNPDDEVKVADIDESNEYGIYDPRNKINKRRRLEN